MKKLLLLTGLLLCALVQAQDATVIVSQAKADIDKGNTLQAQKALQSVLDTNPDHAEANYLMAKSYTAKRNFPQSAKYIDRAIAAEPSNITYRKLRINSITSASGNDDLQKAISDLNFLISSGEISAKIYNALASAEKELGSNLVRHSADKTSATYKEAIAHFERAKSAYSKALELDQVNKVKFEYEVKQLDNDIAEAKKLM